MTSAGWSGPVKVTKADGTIEYEEPLSPREMGRLATAEEREDTEAAAEIVRRPRLRIKKQAARRRP